MAHILFVTPYYPPEITAPAIRISETAEGLVKSGHQVTVLTNFPNFPSGVVLPEYRGHVIQQEEHNGVRIIRVWSYISPNKGFLRRILAQLSFGCLAPLLGGNAIDHPDVIIVESPPLFDAVAGRLLAWRKGCPFIFTVSDLWPDSAVQLGMLRNRLLIRLAQWLEWSTYQRAAAVWALTAGLHDTLIKRGLSPEHVFLVTNGVDTTKFRPLPKAQARAELGWEDHFTILYAGNHGLVYELTTVLDAAEQMRDYADIRIILVGDGVKKAELIAQAQSRKLKNITFLKSMPHDHMPMLFAAADVCIIPLRKLPLIEATLPFKMFEAMACACPILLGGDGEARRLAEQEAGAAMYVEPENAAALVSALLYLREHPEVAETLGQRGRAFVQTRFDRGLLTRALETRIEMLLGKEGPASTSMTPTPLSTLRERN